MAAELNAYISFTLKHRLKLSSKPHEAILKELGRANNVHLRYYGLQYPITKYTN